MNRASILLAGLVATVVSVAAADHHAGGGLAPVAGPLSSEQAAEMQRRLDETNGAMRDLQADFGALRREVAKATKAPQGWPQPGPAGEDGRDGADGRDGVDGRDGKDADPDTVASIVLERLGSREPANGDGPGLRETVVSTAVDFAYGVSPLVALLGGLAMGGGASWALQWLSRRRARGGARSEGFREPDAGRTPEGGVEP